MAKSASAFNLLDEPWIRVLNRDCAVEEVSLRDALLRAHGLKDLAGELPTQDAALLRLLLAVLFAVFARVDAAGRPAPLAAGNAGIEAALARWKELWALGRFPEAPIEAYFATWHDRFWLFDDDHPFWQVPEKKWKTAKNEPAGTKYTAAKLNGEISESDNKPRLFMAFSGVGKEALTYAQAARWLLCVNAYDDTSAKPSERGLPSVGAGWVGRLGFIQVQGKTLFETLMLNLTLLKDGKEAWAWDFDNVDRPWLYRPCWELDAPRAGERTAITWPQNPAAWLTLQSRRLRLVRAGDDAVRLSKKTPPKPAGKGKRKGKTADKQRVMEADGMLPGFEEAPSLPEPVPEPAVEATVEAPAKTVPSVAGYLLLGGDFFDKEAGLTRNTFNEQMTIWKPASSNRDEADSVPKRHDFAKQFWREFPAVFVPKKVRRPGVVAWVEALRQHHLLERRALARFRVCGVGYGDKDFFVNDTYSDGLAFHAHLLDDLGKRWRAKVVEEIGKCERLANAVGTLAKELAMAAGDKNAADEQGARARNRLYFRLDHPFRAWLRAFDPEAEEETVEAAFAAWEATAKRLARTLGEALVREAGPAAFVGRKRDGTVVKGVPPFVSAPQAHDHFLYTVNLIYAKEKETP